MWGMLAGTIAGGAMDIAKSGMNNRQYNQNRDKDMARQKNMETWRMQLMKDYWNSTNYGAQMEHLKKAGLNPALMYQQGGSGGTTANPTGSTTSGEAFHDFTMAQSMMDIGLKKAQKENIEADTAKKEVEADNLESTKNLTDTENELRKIAVKKENETFTSYIERYEAETNKILGEMESALRQAEVDTNTVNARIDKIKYEAVQEMLKNANIETNTKKLINDIKNDNIRVKNESDLAKFQQEYPGMDKVKGNVVNGVLGFIKKLYETE